MKKAVTLTIILTALWLTSALAQKAEQKKDIIRKTDVATLQKISREAEVAFIKNKKKAHKLADEKGWIKRRVMPNGGVIELVGIKRGEPLYYITHNENAAATTGANQVWENGGRGLALSGENLNAGVWDGGGVLTTHQEFGGRVIQKDDPEGVGDHATHVSGTIAAGGVDAAAIGMAQEATILSYDWNNDISEIAWAASDGLLVSNHSYGFAAGWTWDGSDWQWLGDESISTQEDYKFGLYSEIAVLWDELALNAPYLLMFISTGNDRGEGPFNEDYPVDGGTDGFDCITGKALGKNVMAVGSVDDLPEGYESADQVVSSSFSSWGPADDGRIKPDITGNGSNLYSSVAAGDDNYMSMSGTSMASPNVTGSALLLQEHYNNLFGDYMRAATLKALIIHSANEAGPDPGPDYMFGWGLMNTPGAAQVISDNLQNAFIQEKQLENEAEYKFQVFATGDEPLKATIAWHDVPGTPVEQALDPKDPMLVNDLDLRVMNETSNYLPWVLDPENPAGVPEKADNKVDNVEQVVVEAPETGVYTIRVTHKGELVDGPQNFSLVVTGVEANAPGVFAADAQSSTEIQIDWLPNVDKDEVLLAFNTEESFGKPVDGEAYTPGDAIPGGGTVLYKGADSSFVHENLQSGKMYHYRAWSVDADLKYSTTVADSAQTLYDQVFADGFETDKGWTLTGEFERDIPNGLGGSADDSYPDPVIAPEKLRVLGTDLTGKGNYPGDYEYGLAKNQYMAVTPVMDCSNYTNMRLRFQRWLNVEDPEDVDRAAIEISTDAGNTWEVIWENDKEITDRLWSEKILDVSGKADGQDDVKFRFTIGPTGYGQHFSGWNIDDFHAEGVVNKYPVTFVITDGDGPLENAAVEFHNKQKMTGAGGRVTFSNVEIGTKWDYTVRKNNFANQSGTIQLTGDAHTEEVAMLAGNATYKAAFVVDNGINFQEGVSIAFNGTNRQTDGSGRAVFDGVAAGSELHYTLSQNSHTEEGALTITDRNVEEAVTLTYNVQFVVENEGTPVSGASVRLYGYGSKTTGNQGKTTFSSVAADEDIPYLADAAGFQDQPGTVSVLDDDKTLQLAMQKNYQVTFSVTDGNAPVDGAFVVIDRDTTFAESPGVISLGLLNGTYDYKVGAPGYKGSSGSFTLSDADHDEAVILTPESFTVTLNITNGYSPIPDAAVHLNGETLTTNSMGRVTSVLTPGNYPFDVEKADYDTIRDTLKLVNHDVSLNLAMERTTYELTLNITGNGSPLEGARVIFDADTLIADAAGQVLLALHPGEYTYKVEAEGYQPVERSLTMESREKAVDVPLNPFYELAISVMNTSGDPMEEVVISIAEEKYVTGDEGSIFTKLIAGTYKYTAAISGFQVRKSTIELEGDTSVTLVLYATSIQTLEAGNIAIYPNPTSGTFRVVTPQGNPYALTVRNMSGKTIISRQLNGTMEAINLEAMPDGMYLIRLQNADEVIQQKLIKE